MVYTQVLAEPFYSREACTGKKYFLVNTTEVNIFN